MSRLKTILSFLFSFSFKVIVWVFLLLKKIIRSIHTKKRLYLPFYTALGYFFFVTTLIFSSGDSKFDKRIDDRRINDVTQLNPIQTGQIIQPKTPEEIIKAIKRSTGPISIGGGKFSMGGQTGFTNSLHLDMRKYNKIISFTPLEQTITVQSGITWRELQKVIDKENLSIKIMQTYANFTVGGSISVNCHGRYIGHGPIISSIKGIKLINASGENIVANRTQNYDVFRAAIGGYGGIGVISEVTLGLDLNTKVERQTKQIEVKDYVAFFNSTIRNDSSVIFQNGDLYPPNYSTINNISWKVSSNTLTDTTRVTPSGESYWLESQLLKLVSWGDFGKWTRRNVIDPFIYRSKDVVWRNKEASYDVAELEPSSREENTYVLQEYFIPIDNIESFIPKMKAIYEKHDVNIINVSLRHAYPDLESYLSWATEEVFAFVIYYKQGTGEKAKESVKIWTKEMTNAILSENGKWYLPYQPHASVKQFNTAFKNAPKYFALKNKLDSTHRFNNQLLDKYNPFVNNSIDAQKKNIKGYYREEEQTILTVPEWYLVFNPKEYADFLEKGKNPSEFPYYASIDEYWKLYDRSITLVSNAYPENEEYKTMLQVIGVSITMEYAFKILYENTIGWLFSNFANESTSNEEQTIAEANRAYSDFIYDTAWYEFEFTSWIRKLWSCSNNGKGNFIRKWERSLIFTLEFSFKAAYAQLIEWAAKSSYETPVTTIYIKGELNKTEENSSLFKIIKQKENTSIIGIPRWGEFTNTVLKLKPEDLQINDIGGNDQIAVSVIMNRDKLLNFNSSELLYTSEIVTDKKNSRGVYFIKVDRLLTFIHEVRQFGKVEHIYDY